MLIKCAFVGHKNFDIYRNAQYYNNKKHVCDMETNAPVITHQKLNYMSVICKVMPLSTPTINQPQQFLTHLNRDNALS
jgi:hypothetical protein